MVFYFRFFVGVLCVLTCVLCILVIGAGIYYTRRVMKRKDPEQVELSLVVSHEEARGFKEASVQEGDQIQGN